jgi:hypothetical protein
MPKEFRRKDPPQKHQNDYMKVQTFSNITVCEIVCHAICQVAMIHVHQCMKKV